MRRRFTIKCKQCQRNFYSKAGNKRFCGTIQQKTGCSYKRLLDASNKAFKKWYSQNAQQHYSLTLNWKREHPELHRLYTNRSRIKAALT